MEPRSPERRTDVDWLRVFAIYLLFPFHVAMVFNPAPFYHVRNADLSIAMLVFAGFVSQWHMPLLFLLAGWSALASLEARGRRGFVTERVRKLAIPLAMGCILLAPPIKYLELASGLDLSASGLRVSADLQESFRAVIPGGLPLAAPFDEGFLEFLPTFFTRLERFTWSHLWFLAYLFTFALLYLPVFAWLGRRRGRLPGPAVAWVYLPVLPLALVQVTLRPRWPGVQNLYDDWANFAYYSTYLLAGFTLACQPALERAVERERKHAAAIGLGAMGVLLGSVLGVVSSPTVILAGSAVAGWCSVLALLGFARAHAPRTSRALGYLTESAFPVYLLHQSAIVLLGYLAVQLPWGIAPKFVLLLLAAVAATLAVYHFAVRRFRVLRFLFGMKVHPAPAGPARLPSRAAAASLLGAVLAGAAAAATARAPTPLGRWWAEGGAAQVEIRRCEDGLCGDVVWLRSPFDEDGCTLLDRHNGDLALRDQPVLGLRVLRGLDRAPGGDGTWKGGTIYDPATGNTYRSTLTLEGEDRLHLRGYVGIPLLGRTTTWVRVGTENTRCAP